LDKKGSELITISLKYLRHLLLAGHRRGYGIHSPFVYDLVRSAISPGKYALPEALVSYHRTVLGMKGMIGIRDLGAGSRVTEKKERSIASIARNSSITRRQGGVLFRLCKWYRPPMVIELGTGLGISTSYLAAGADMASLVTIEGSPEKHAFAQKHTPVYDAGSVEFLLGDFSAYFPQLAAGLTERTIVFIDGDHRYAPTMEKVGMLLEQDTPAELMIILDDIYWSAEMEQMWKDAVSDERVDISIDLFRFGILVKRPGIEKQHFRLFF